MNIATVELTEREIAAVAGGYDEFCATPARFWPRPYLFVIEPEPAPWSVHLGRPGP